MAGKRRISRLTAGVAAAAAPVLLLAGPAAADTAQARAQAARVTLLAFDNPTYDTGRALAFNEGGGLAYYDPSPNPTITPGQSVVISGTFAQDAFAGSNGRSGACAGAFNPGGAIQFGLDGTCVLTNDTSNGGSVYVDLNQRGSFTASAILAECTATSGAAPTGRTTLTDTTLHFFGFDPGGSTYIPVVLEPNPAPNEVVAFSDSTTKAFITLNEQIPIPGGGLTVNAVHLTILPNEATGSPQADVVLGSVTCGPNADTEPVSIYSGPALPSAAAGVAVVLATRFVRRRRSVA